MAGLCGRWERRQKRYEKGESSGVDVRVWGISVVVGRRFDGRRLRLSVVGWSGWGGFLGSA